MLAGLFSAWTAIGGALADPSQKAAGKLNVGAASGLPLADAGVIEKAGGPGESHEVLREPGLSRPPWARRGPRHWLQSPGPPPEKARLLFPEHDLPAVALLQVALLAETMPLEPEPAREVNRLVHLDLQSSRQDTGSQPVEVEHPEDSGLTVSSSCPE